MAGQPARSQAKKQGTQDGTTSGNEEGRCIGPDRERFRSFTVGEKPQQIAVGCPGEENGQRASAERQQERLDQNLLHQPRACCSERAANRKLMFSRRRSRQAKPGEIYAADQQHHADENLQQEQRPLILRTQNAPALAAWPHRETRSLDHSKMTDGGRKRLIDCHPVNGGHLRGSGFATESRLEARPYDKPKIARLAQNRARSAHHRLIFKRQVKIRMHGHEEAFESFRSDADDGDAVIGQRNVLPDDRRIGMIMLLPEAVTDHGCPSIGPSAALIIFGSDESARGRLDAQNLKCISTDHGPGVNMESRFFFQDEVVGAPSEGAGQRFRVSLDGFEKEDVQRLVAHDAVRRVNVESNAHQAIRLRNWQALEQQSVCQRKDAGVRADAEGESQNRSRRKCRRLDQLPHRKLCVGHQRLDSRPLPHFAATLLDHGRVAEGAACGVFRFFAAHALANQLLGLLFEVLAHLLGEIAVKVAAAPENPKKETRKPAHGVPRQEIALLVSSTRAMPSNMRSKLEISRSRCFMPAAVIWYVRTRRLVEETPHSALTSFALSRRCNAGYSEPSSTWSRLLERCWMCCTSAYPCAG